jgi:predicted dithiol-disulfide oxidoreductase (DUF899 family)
MNDDFPRMAFSNESAEYRAARNALLDAEMRIVRISGHYVSSETVEAS